MFRLTLTLVPRGDERRARELGRVEIENACLSKIDSVEHAFCELGAILSAL